jgi:predicted nucleotidyltransferase
MTKTTQTLNQESLDEIIRRIVVVTAPERIILFGSAARGEMDPRSNLDLLSARARSSMTPRKRYPPDDPREWLGRAP